MRLALLMAAALLVAACGSVPKKQPSYYADDGPPESVPSNLGEIPEATPKDEPFHRGANKPYTVFGKTYVPVVNKEPFRERGIASWYGKKFQGQKTASGEPYDMFAMTAAHPTLPIPSYARVTNVKNGKSVVVRINDRGPFHSNRIIDLSYAAAARIGLAGPGSGMVEVERVFEPGPAVARPAPRPPPAAIETGMVVEDNRNLWLQLGAFSSRDSADAFRDKAVRDLAWNNEPLDVSVHDGLYRVRLGPYRNRAEADAIAEKVRTTLGFAPAVTNR
ncbi:MAG TPA: septal ring lytic transglycosylase RlpA family protein [Usitatibacter sp.]|jgi:rare lipoprotein A|nr:septal ring lytic transglycosylase RlpA family protein [Usitatibacter sp.]